MWLLSMPHKLKVLRETNKRKKCANLTWLLTDLWNFSVESKCNKVQNNWKIHNYISKNSLIDGQTSVPEQRAGTSETAYYAEIGSWRFIGWKVNTLFPRSVTVALRQEVVRISEVTITTHPQSLCARLRAFRQFLKSLPVFFLPLFIILTSERRQDSWWHEGRVKRQRVPAKGKWVSEAEMKLWRHVCLTVRLQMSLNHIYFQRNGSLYK